MRCLMVKYSSEITLKGLNRKYFEEELLKEIKRRIGQEHKIDRESGRFFIYTYSDEMIEELQKVFGILRVAVADIVEKDMEAVNRAAAEQIRTIDGIKTFKVESKRADKRFPLNSMEISREAGGYILKSVEGIRVDVHAPDVIVNIEVRDKVYVYAKEYEGLGGMPYRSAGKGMLLLSGGIDSPVAGFMMARRGLELSCVYYHSHPYTSGRAKDKVVDLAKRLSEYTGPIRLNIISFTKIQMDIIEKCPEDELTIIMRRFMMKLAELAASREGAKALVTGESLGQVASQTLESILVTNSELKLPVFRPLIGMHKVDIMDISRKIGTYDISILPYEDCCTIFVPKHPKTRPRLEEIRRSEEKLDMTGLMEEALLNAEILVIDKALE
ncbi:MAG TPA: tRNA uracil 4-sulfurtransferase ThiI [Clostridia bacterium]|nr:tRNA uracil 4-sulfurtransferase ThiI [Clostridia bacterium]